MFVLWLQLSFQVVVGKYYESVLQFRFNGIFISNEGGKGCKCIEY